MDRRGFSHLLRKNWAPYLSISPFYLLFLIFGIYPILYSFVISLYKWNANKPWIFIGLKNYHDLLFKDPVFWISIWNAIYLLLLNVPVILLLSVIIAVVLNSPRQKLKDFFRITYLLPYVTSVLSISILFFVLLDDQMGTVNSLLQLIHLKPVLWLTSPRLSKISITIVIVWKWIGYNMIVALAGLQSIPMDIYDAVRIDGAGRVRTFFRITLPLLTPVLGFQVLTATIGTLTIFSEPFLLTAGGPGYSSISPVLYLYRTSFKFFNLDKGATIAVLTFILVLVPSLFQLRIWVERDRSY